MMKPLIKLNQRQICLVSPTICGMHFIEALFSEFRKYFRPKELDDLLGKPLERFVRCRLEEKGIQVHHGDFAGGDCDALVRTENKIILFEVKKKPLRRRSRAGDLSNLAEDLSKGLIKAATQLSTQISLLKDPEGLTLTSDDNRTSICLNDKKIVPVIIFLNGYGALLDRGLSRKYLLEILNSSLKQKCGQPFFIKCKQEMHDLIAEFSCIQVNVAMKSDSQIMLPCLNFSLLNLPQFLHITEKVHNTMTLEEAIMALRHFSYGSRDFYFEHAISSSLSDRPYDS